MKLKNYLLGMVAALGFSIQAAQALPLAADIVVIIDESGSMGGEQAFVKDVIPDLEAALVALGIGTGADANQYGLVGFGGHVTGQVGHSHLLAGNVWGSSADFVTAAGTLVTSGGTEDGYEAIDFTLGAYTNRTGNYARQYILVTDEDRDVIDGSLTFSSINNALSRAGITLNAILNIQTNPTTALGITATGLAYIPDGAGGFTKSTGGSVTGGSGSTVADYANLAQGLGGAAWDLNKLRAGGLTADSFAAAFVDAKVTEIITPPQTVPEPAIIALMGLGLAGLGIRRRRKA